MEDNMSKGFKTELDKIDESISRIKKWISEGRNMYHMLRYFEKKRMNLVNKIGR